MNIKRYIAKDMMEATRKIREDLGPDAVILHNKPIRKKGLKYIFAPPMVEVVVAYEPESLRIIRQKPEAPKKPSSRDEKLRELDGKINDLQAMLDNLQASRAAAPPPAKPAQSRLRLCPQNEGADIDTDALIARLTGQDVLEDVARILAAKAKRLAKTKGLNAREALDRAVLEHVGEPQPIQLRKFERTVVMMFGPTGVGKTTSLIKLASQFALEKKLRVGLINADTYRLAAHEQIKAFAELMGTPLSVVHSPEEVAAALREHEDKDIVFIDTTGKRPGDIQHKSDIERMVRLSGATEVFLVISAPTSTRACREIVAGYGVGEYKLIVTKADETDPLPMILNTSWIANRPLSYIANGQNVPDDIQVADISGLINRSLEGAEQCANRLAN